jgi:hypothetical protein
MTVVDSGTRFWDNFAKVPLSNVSNDPCLRLRRSNPSWERHLFFYLYSK